jgi:hypothetical protein
MTPNNRWILAAAGCLAALSIASSAQGSLSRAIAFDEKVDKAEAIVLGKCVATRSQWDPQHRFILTYSTFQVEKSIKGQPGSQVTVVTPGGSVGEIHQSSIGIPGFQEGDEHVVFVKNTPVGPTVLYFDQGAYDVHTEANGEKTIAPVATGAVHLDTQRGMAVAAEAPRTLREFENDVHVSSQRHRTEMEMVRTRGQQQQPVSLVSLLLRYKLLVAIAIAGLALATWQFLRR